MAKTNIRQHQQRAQKMKRRVNTFLNKLIRMRKPLTYFDYRVNKLNKEVFKVVDCTTCANCCKQMTPTYTKTDLRRISKHLGMTVKTFIEKYCTIQDGDFINIQQPCQFLGKDDKCTIYDVRPLDCRQFPHTHRREFKYHLEVTKNNVLYCPAALRVVEGMMVHFDTKK